MADELEKLGLGLHADHKAEQAEQAKPKRSTGRKAAEKAGDKAAADAKDAGSPPEDAEALKEVVTDGATQAVDAVTSPAEEEAAIAKAGATVDAPVPPSPGDDAESVWDRRVERLSKIVAETEFESGTAYGDLRDLMLELFKHRPKVWSAMGESEKRDMTRAIEATCKTMLDKVVLLVAQEGDEGLQAKLTDQFAVKGEKVEAKLVIEHIDKEVLLDLYGMAGARVVIVRADSKRFMNSRRDVEIEPDQMGMQFADPAPKQPEQPAEQPTHPADDSDLADGADDDAKDAAPGKEWGVFDNEDGEWLAKLATDAPVGEDRWSKNSVDAVRLTQEEAAKEAETYGEGFVARLLGDDEPTETQDKAED